MKQIVTVRLFLPPFSHTLLLYSCFASLMALLGFLPRFLSFYPPRDKLNTLDGMTTSVVREIPKRIGALKIFGHIQVWTPAAFMAGKRLSIALCPSGNCLTRVSLRSSKQSNVAAKPTWNKFLRMCEVSDADDVLTVMSHGIWDCQIMNWCTN